MFSNKPFYSVMVLLHLALMTACSSSSTTTNEDPAGGTTPVQKNVAASSNGGTVTSSFSGNESFTIDEDITTTNFWKGGADGDEVKVSFDKTYSVSKIVIRTNNTSFNITGGVTTSGLRAQLSNDDVTYQEIAIAPFGLSAPIQCFSLSVGSGRIECELNTNVDTKFIKIITTSDFATTEVYEIEVTGS